MPPSSVHFNGSVNLPDSETVMKEISSPHPGGRAPHDRRRDRGARLLDPLPDPEVRRDARVRVGVRPGGRTRPTTTRRRCSAPARRGRVGGHDRLAQPRLRRRLRRVVRDLRPAAEEGTIPADVRFQMQYPTPLASMAGYDRARGPAGRRRGLRAGAVRRPRDVAGAAAARPLRGAVGRRRRVRPARGRDGPRRDADGADHARPGSLRGPCPRTSRSACTSATATTVTSTSSSRSRCRCRSTSSTP